VPSYTPAAGQYNSTNSAAFLLYFLLQSNKFILKKSLIKLNKHLNTVAKQINELLKTVPQKIKSIPENKLSEKPSPDKWSKKEILGHLCDSAMNNIARVIRSQYDELPLPIVSYHQMEWVSLNGYQTMHIDEIINLWSALNRRLSHALSSIPDEKLNKMCVLASGEKISIGKLMEEDYIKHLEHHMSRILEK
jgi:hypothetical protein